MLDTLPLTPLVALYEARAGSTWTWAPANPAPRTATTAAAATIVRIFMRVPSSSMRFQG